MKLTLRLLHWLSDLSFRFSGFCDNTMIGEKAILAYRAAMRSRNQVQLRTAIAVMQERQRCIGQACGVQTAALTLAHILEMQMRRTMKPETEPTTQP